MLAPSSFQFDPTRTLSFSMRRFLNWPVQRSWHVATRAIAFDGNGRPLGPPASSITNVLPGYLARADLVSIAARPRHLFLHLHQHLGQAVGCRRLQCRERPVAFQLLQPQRLADGNDVPVVDVRGSGRTKCAALAREGLRFKTNGRLEGIPLDVVNQRPVEGMDSQ